MKDGFLVGNSRVLPGSSDSNKDKADKAKENRIATRQGPLPLTQENLDFHSKLLAPATPNRLWGEGRALGGATAAWAEHKKYKYQ